MKTVNCKTMLLSDTLELIDRLESAFEADFQEVCTGQDIGDSYLESNISYKTKTGRIEITIQTRVAKGTKCLIIVRKG